MKQLNYKKENDNDVQDMKVNTKKNIPEKNATSQLSFKSKCLFIDFLVLSLKNAGEFYTLCKKLRWKVSYPESFISYRPHLVHQWEICHL